MLKQFLYGKDGDVLHVDSVDEIIEGYRAFTALAQEATNPAFLPEPAQFYGAEDDFIHGDITSRREINGDVKQHRQNLRARLADLMPRPGAAMSAAVDPKADPVAAEAISLLFAKEGNYVQDLVVEEVVRMTDALGREVNLEIVQIMRRVADRMATPFPLMSLRRGDRSSLSPLLLPLQLPIIVMDRMISALEKSLQLSEEDKQSLDALRKLITIIQNTSQNGPANPLTVGAATHEKMLAMIAEEEMQNSRFVDRAFLASVNPRAIIRGASRLAPVLPLIIPGAPKVRKE
jgi:hypothetical protein